MATNNILIKDQKRFLNSLGYEFEEVTINYIESDCNIRYEDFKKFYIAYKKGERPNTKIPKTDFFKFASEHSFNVIFQKEYSKAVIDNLIRNKK